VEAEAVEVDPEAVGQKEVVAVEVGSVAGFLLPKVQHQATVKIWWRQLPQEHLMPLDLHK
jgi:citrate lyase beta subunit